ncbi:MAG: YggS family pyridoxal phosphate-dependent enzyme [Oscillospiraceae bacterium]
MTEKSPDFIAQNVQRIQDEIFRTAAQSKRSPDTIRLMAVTKTNSAERVNQAIAAGITLLGENRAQELMEKFEQYCLPDGAEIHFIGHLQTNKVRQIIDKVNLIESLDRMSLAAEIDRCAAERDLVMSVLIELNIGREESKSGVLPEQLAEFITKAAAFRHLHIRGLMSIPPREGDAATKEGYFDAIHRHFIDIMAKKIDNVSMDILSMGMSEDYLLAIKHGSNIIRLGRAIFGERL